MNITLIIVVSIISLTFGILIGRAWFQNQMDILSDEYYGEEDKIMVRFIEEQQVFEVITIYGKEKVAMVVYMSPHNMKKIVELVEEKV